MDPQNRLLLEQSALALADASCSVSSLTDSKTGVYVGCMYQEYVQVLYIIGLGAQAASENRTALGSHAPWCQRTFVYDMRSFEHTLIGEVSYITKNSPVQ